MIHYLVYFGCRSQQRDPEGLTYDQDWTVHVKELIERRENGLCMDTISGSTKLRRKSMIPGDPEAVLQSVNPLRTPAMSPKNNPKDKQDGEQTIANGTSCVNKEPRSKNSSPEVFQRTEYTWEKLLRQPSNTKIRRSQTFHYNLSEHRPPLRSLNFDREVEGQRDMTRSKSLRGYKHHGSSPSQIFSADEPSPITGIAVSGKNGDRVKERKSLEKCPADSHSDTNATEATANKRRIRRSGSAPSKKAKETVVKHEAEDPPRKRSESLRWIPEPDYQSVSIEELVKNREQTNERSSLEKHFEHQQPATNGENEKVITAKKFNSKERNKQVSRSGSAPSAQAKESVVRREADEPLRQRSVSLRWIPEPDYQSVSVEELATAAQTRDKDSIENHVCVVEIHSPPKGCKSNVSKSVGTGEIGNSLQEQSISPGSSSKKSKAPHHGDQQENTSGDLASKLPLPGVAQRIPTESIVGSDKTTELRSGTGMETKDIKEDTVSVKNRIQNLESQIPPGKINSGSRQGSPTETNLVDSAANLATSTSNSYDKPKSLLNSNEKPSACLEVAKEEPKIDNSPAVLSSSMSKKPAVRSIGKMKIVKSDDTPAWLVNQERTLKRPIRDQPSQGLLRTSSATTNQFTDQSSTSNVVVLDNKTVAPRQSTSDLVRAALKNKNKSNTTDDNNNLNDVEAQGNDAKEPISPRNESVKDQDTCTTVTKDADTGLSLEEKKKKWKREQIVDQLQSARQRNSNQNYVFGTGLAYQSCMPELQNKLKQLTLSK